MNLTVNHVGPIDDNFVNGIQNFIYAQTQPIEFLRLNISSQGGGVIFGITAYNFLKQLPFPVFTHNLGEVSSAAILPYLAGSTRTAEAFSKFMFHPVEISVGNNVPFFKVEELLNTVNADIDMYCGIVRKELPQLSEKYDIHDLLTHNSLTISTMSDAIEFGIVTG